MHVIPLLVTLAATSAAQSPAERWVPFTANPAYEVFGAEDTGGVFRYSKSRRKAAEMPVVNFGVNLSGPAPSPGAPIVMGTDKEIAKLLVPRASAGTPSPCAHSDCPNGRCDRERPLRPKPKPNSLPEFAMPKLDLKPIHVAMAVGGFFGLMIVGMLFVLVCFCAYFLISYLFKGRSRP